MNFLQSLFNPQRSPSMPFNPAGAPAMPMPPMQGSLQRMTQGAPMDNRIANIMQAIGGAPETPAVQMQQQAPVNPAEPPKRPKRSLLDIIGGISDVIAQVGGADPMYQPTLDAREDRAKEIDLDALRKQILEQQATVGGQTIQSNAMELEDTVRGRSARVLGALANNPNAAALWPQLAAQAGIDEQSAATIGQIIQANPENVGVLAQALGFEPAGRKGSQAKELQVYELLNSRDPALGDAYLQSLTNPDSMSEYQQANLAIALEQLRLSQQKEAFDQNIEERKLEQEQSGAADLTPTQRGNVVQKLKLLPNVRAQYNRVRQLYDEMVADGTMARGALGGLVPGAIAGGKAEQFDKAAGALRKSILSLTRIPGVGSMSNYETVLDEQALPSRWGSDEGRLEAINGIGTVLDSYEQGYKDMLGTPAPARRSGGPSGRSGSGERVVPRLPARTRPAAAAGRNPAVEAELRRRGLID